VANAFLADHVDVICKPATAVYYRDIIERIVLPSLGARKADTLQTTPRSRENAYHWPGFTPPAAANRRRSSGLLLLRHVHVVSAARRSP